MQQDLQQAGTTAIDPEESIWTPAARRRTLLVLIALLCLLLLVVVPPYFSISRYQRRVATAISGSLGRAVHFDDITVHLLPIPGLTIRNFVVTESPDFGAEPVLRANSVDARLRVSSLWRRRIEISRISLESPSINLVRRPGDGRWNLQGILMQASQMQAAPTAQQRAGEAPRFPYIEATDARINIKDGDNKLPFSVKEAEFALWLPQPDQWRLRMVGKPVRTDTDVNDVGLLRVEATLGRAADLPNAPIDLSLTWKPTPLGEAAKLTAGYDLGWRGDASMNATLRGTLRSAKLSTDVHLVGLHRADFLPAQNAEIDAHCEAASEGLLRSLHDVRCAVPTSNSLTLTSIMDTLRKVPAATGAETQPDNAVRPGVLLLRGEVPNLLDWQTASGSLSLTGAAVDYAVTWARLFTQAIPASVDLGGTFNLSASTDAAGTGHRRWEGTLTCACVLPAPVVAPREKQSAAPEPNRWTVVLSHDGEEAANGGDPGPRDSVNVIASPEPSEGRDKAIPEGEPTQLDAQIAGRASRGGYVLRYRSRAALAQAAAVVPLLAEGAPADADGPLVAGGGWSAPASWKGDAAPEHKPSRDRRHRRR